MIKLAEIKRGEYMQNQNCESNIELNKQLSTGKFPLTVVHL